MKRYFPVALCLCYGLAPAQDDRGGIEGQVLNGATGEPLSKAAVTLLRLDSRSRGGPTGTVTGADGKFVLLDIDPGRYRVSVLYDLCV